ncbi:MAG: cell envelope integrity protein TolA [Rickettsiaceae bacterium]|nr:cell envelope integrity protein TolA [Rickettsiaceae bacterium]
MTKDQNNDLIFKISVIVSILLHLIFIIWLYHGGAGFIEKFPEQEEVMTFEMVPTSELRNIKPKKKKVEKEQKKEQKKITKEQATDTKKEQPKKDLKEKSISKKQPDKKTQEEVKKPAKIDSKEQESKTEIAEIKEKPKKAKTKKQAKEKADKKPETKSKKTAKKKQTKNDDFTDSLLKNLEKEQNTKPKMFDAHIREFSLEEIKTTYDENSPLSITEKDVLRRQIQLNWYPPSGLKKLHEMRVVINLKLLKNGNIEDSRVLGVHCPKGEEDGCRKLIDSALRALRISQPLQDLDKDRYDNWKNFTIIFSPINVIP